MKFRFEDKVIKIYFSLWKTDSLHWITNLHYNWKEMENVMPRKYPAFVYWVSHILSPAFACLCCYMPISAASDLLCVFFIERVTGLFNIWRKKFQLFNDDSLTSMEDSHQDHEIPKQIRLLFDFCCCLCPTKHKHFIIVVSNIFSFVSHQIDKLPKRLYASCFPWLWTQV